MMGSVFRIMVGFVVVAQFSMFCLNGKIIFSLTLDLTPEYLFQKGNTATKLFIQRKTS